MRSRLAILLAVASVPVLGIALDSVLRQHRDSRAALVRDVVLTREAIAARYEAVVEGVEQTLGALSRTPTVLRGSVAACDELLAGVLQLQSDRISSFGLHEVDGRRRCSALPAPRTGTLADQPWIERAVTARQMVLGPFAVGPQSGAAVLVAAYPVMGEDGTVVSVLATGIRLSHLAARAESVDSARHTRIWLLDPSGGTVAPAMGAAADLPPAPLLARLRRGEVHEVLDVDRSGRMAVFAAKALGDGMSILVAMPADAALAAQRELLIRRLAELAAILVIGLVTMLTFANYSIVRPLRRLNAALIAWREQGGRFNPGSLAGTPSVVRELAQSLGEASAALDAREQELRRTIAQRDLLMAEIHHRVKNNLQVVASLLNLQAGRIRQIEARAEFAAARDRVRALATLHRHLYVDSRFDRVRLADFIAEMAEQLFISLGETANERIVLEIDVADVTLSADQAVPLALIVTEAVTNALKYAFPEGRGGRIAIRARAEGDRLRFAISDDGVGLASTRDQDSGDGLGAKLIQGFVRQLDATLTIEENGGTSVIVDMPLVLRPAAPEPPVAANANAPPAA